MYCRRPKAAGTCYLLCVVPSKLSLLCEVCPDQIGMSITPIVGPLYSYILSAFSLSFEFVIIKSLCISQIMGTFQLLHIKTVYTGYWKLDWRLHPSDKLQQRTVQPFHSFSCSALSALTFQTSRRMAGENTVSAQRCDCLHFRVWTQKASETYIYMAVQGEPPCSQELLSAICPPYF